MSDTLLDLSTLFDRYPAGCWLAFSESKDQVIAVGNDAVAVQQQGKDLGEPNPLMLRVPEHEQVMFFLHRQSALVPDR